MSRGYVVCCVRVGMFGVRCVVCVGVEIYIYLWCGVGRRIFFNVCLFGGECLAGGDDWRCPNRFCLLGYPVRSCCVSIAMFARFIVSCFRLCGSLLSFTRVYLYYWGEARLFIVIFILLCCALLCVGFRRYRL